MSKIYNFFNMNRNYKNVQHEELRIIVDSKWTTLHDELSDCYYNFWKKGLSKPFQAYDVQATPEESKTLFDKLHGLIEDKRMIDLYDEFKKLPEGDEKEKIKSHFDSYKIDDVKDKVNQLKINGIKTN